MKMKLFRSQNDCSLAGVCGGLAANFGWSSSRLRIVWVLAMIFTAFAGVVLYVALWFLMPKESKPAPVFDTPPLQPWKNST